MYAVSADMCILARQGLIILEIVTAFKFKLSFILVRRVGYIELVVLESSN